MRVIGGSCRGRPLRAPAGTATRPTGDRVREAIFDVLGSLEPVEGRRVLDLFAGSGAMGIEALSRGAVSAVFVDKAPSARAAVQSNLDALGLADRARVVRAEVLGWLATQAAEATQAAAGAEGAGAAGGFDLALCDPPYDFDQWATLLDQLPAPLAVLESSQPVELSPPWEVVRQKRYGGTLVTVVRRAGAGPTAQDDQKGSP